MTKYIDPPGGIPGVSDEGNAEGNAERVCPNTDTEIHIQELALRAENQHENLQWQII